MQLIEFYVTERAGELGERMRDWALPSHGSALSFRGRPCRVRDVLHSPRLASVDRLPDPPIIVVAAPQDADPR